MATRTTFRRVAGYSKRRCWLGRNVRDANSKQHALDPAQARLPAATASKQQQLVVTVAATMAVCTMTLDDRASSALRAAAATELTRECPWRDERKQEGVLVRCFRDMERGIQTSRKLIGDGRWPRDLAADEMSIHCQKPCEPLDCQRISNRGFSSCHADPATLSLAWHLGCRMLPWEC